MEIYKWEQLTFWQVCCYSYSVNSLLSQTGGCDPFTLIDLLLAWLRTCFQGFYKVKASLLYSLELYCRMENQIECIQNYNSIHVPFLDKIPYNPTLISRECFEVLQALVQLNGFLLWGTNRNSTLTVHTAIVNLTSFWV